jgi:hypothetical protein
MTMVHSQQLNNPKYIYTLYIYFREQPTHKKCTEQCSIPGEKLFWHLLTMPWVYSYAFVMTSIFLMDLRNPRYPYSYFLEIYDGDCRIIPLALFVFHEYVTNVILLQSCVFYALIVFGHVYIVSKLISISK